MKKINLILIAVFFTFSIAFQSEGDKLARPVKYKGTLVYVMSEPVDDYEVIENLNSAGAQFLTALVSESSADALNIEELIGKMINRAEKLKKKGKMESYDAIITKDGNEGTLIKFKERKNEYLARPEKEKGVMAYIMSEPVDDYEVVDNLTTAGSQFLTALVSESSADAQTVEQLVGKMIDRANKMKKKGKIESYDGIITKNGDEGTIIKFKQ